jgi:Asp-tRNA(Asn)/Glu-tRNA(Gln) amidotransferase A subunit family amidase
LKATMSDLASRGPGGLNLLTATAAAGKLRDGSATSVQLVEHCLARIAARDSDVHAWAFVDKDLAINQARARDQEQPRSALHGVPVGIRTSSTPMTCRPPRITNLQESPSGE